MILDYFKNIKNIIVIGLVIVVLSTITIQYNTIKNLNNQYSTSVNNTKALMAENKALQDGTVVYQFRIDQLEYFKDSINIKMDSILKVNKIQKEKIKQLSYTQISISRTDTLFLRDTIFKKDFKLDTLIVKPFYSLNLKLAYPNKIEVNPKFTNEQYAVFNFKKETIEPPKKFFLLRWFQKKQTIVTVDVFNSNPDVTIEKQRFIEIIH